MIDRTKVALIACSATKAPQASPALELYTSHLFTLSLAYARQQGIPDERIHVLSAKHGLLSAEDVVEPYDMVLTSLSKRERREWAGRVLLALAKRYDIDETRFIALAGEAYVEHLHLEHLSQPLRGFGLGTRKQWLKRAVEQGVGA